MDNETQIRLHAICHDYYEYLDQTRYVPSKKVQYKIMKAHGVRDDKYYPLETSCKTLESILEHHRDAYRH